MSSRDNPLSMIEKVMQVFDNSGDEVGTVKWVHFGEVEGPPSTSAADSQAEVEVRAGEGVGAVEAPRGILFHEYAYDDSGRCRFANHVIPTAQNLANIEADMRLYAFALLAESRSNLRQCLEMMVRAYDPCISCSTHVLDL